MRNSRLFFTNLRCLSLIILAGCILAFPAYPVQAGRQLTPPPPNQGHPAYISNPFTDVPALSTFEAEFSGCGGGFVPAENSPFEQRVVELVNAERAAVGLLPLKKINQLDQAARYQAADMFQDNYFSHDTYDLISGQLQKVCAWYTRISSYYLNWTDLGENIAAGYQTPESVVAGWMSSSGHKANILRDTFYETGVGYYAGYWVQDFGKRNGVFPVVINNEAVSTTSRDVTLSIFGVWTDMRIQNNADGWSAWQPFHNTLAWQLPNTPGNQTVFVELRTTGMTASSSDSIYLDIQQQPELVELPHVITFTYSTSTDELLPTYIPLTLSNTGTQDPLNWQASTSNPWLIIEPKTGATPGTLTISIDSSTTNNVGTYSGSIDLSVTSPPGVLSASQSISIKLIVVNTAFPKVYLPLTAR